MKNNSVVVSHSQKDERDKIHIFNPDGVKLLYNMNRCIYITYDMKRIL